jgi:hypothetical protein
MSVAANTRFQLEAWNVEKVIELTVKYLHGNSSSTPKRTYPLMVIALAQVKLPVSI